MKPPVERPPEEPDRMLMSVNDAADLCGISRGKAYEMAQSGEWPVVRIGGRVMIRRDKLIEWIDDRAGECVDG